MSWGGHRRRPESIRGSSLDERAPDVAKSRCRPATISRCLRMKIRKCRNKKKSSYFFRDFLFFVISACAGRMAGQVASMRPGGDEAGRHLDLATFGARSSRLEPRIDSGLLLCPPQDMYYRSRTAKAKVLDVGSPRAKVSLQVFI